MTKPEITIPAKKLELYDKLIGKHPDIARKGKVMPYTSLNGHMFTFLSKEGVMGLRLSKSDRDSFMKKFDAVLIEQYGRVMKEYVEVPDSLLHDTKKLFTFLEKSYEYVSTLKPKPTKR